MAYGRESANRLAIQVVYNTCRLLDEGAELSAAFGATWRALQTETANPNWSFAAVANINCFVAEVRPDVHLQSHTPSGSLISDSAVGRARRSSGSYVRVRVLAFKAYITTSYVTS